MLAVLDRNIASEGNMATREAGLPPGFRLGHDEQLACPHRDCSTCDDCVKAHPEIVEVFGAHFWMADEVERKDLITLMAKS